MGHYTHLTTEERELIFAMWISGSGVRMIARRIGRSPSTVSRELGRNSGVDGGYSPSRAQARYAARRKACRRKRILSDPDIKVKVAELLDLKWSPEQISGRLVHEGNSVRVSFASIYRGIYSGLFDRHSRGEAKRGLRHRGKRRHRKGEAEKRGKISITHEIGERPNGATDRSEPGHFEADTVLGKAGGSCLVTLVDRMSRFLVVRRVEAKSSVPVADAMVDMLRGHNPRSVTPDRGKEFARHADVTAKLGVEFYFPAPHAPWQRGTNENTNGLIREYAPKGSDLSALESGEVEGMGLALNTRPRKCLGWKTPYEVHYGKVLHLT